MQLTPVYVDLVNQAFLALECDRRLGMTFTPILARPQPDSPLKQSFSTLTACWTHLGSFQKS